MVDVVEHHFGQDLVFSTRALKNSWSLFLNDVTNKCWGHTDKALPVFARKVKGFPLLLG